MFVLGILGGASGRVITVDDDGPADFDNVQAAIDDANTGDVVEVQPGRYTGEGNRDIDFGGLAITVCSIDANDPNVVAATIIDSGGTSEVPHRAFYFHSGEGLNSIVAGLTITNGYTRYLGGGGVHCINSSPTITRCRIEGNVAEGYGTEAAGDIRILENGYGDYGGGIYCERSSPTISYCIIRNNTANYGGGGICCRRSSPIVTNCLLSGNSAYNGGGIYLFYGSPTIINCTIFANMANRYGGGIYNYYSGSTITSCILWNNSDGGGMDESAQIHVIYGEPSSKSGRAITFDEARVIDYSCIQGWTGNLFGTGNIGADPLVVDPQHDDYHLLVFSPCIDAGDPGHVPGSNETDLDGNPRVKSDRVDMGAYEAVVTAPILHGEPEATSGTSNIISWDPLGGAARYYVVCSEDPCFTSTAGYSGWTAKTNHEFTGLEPGQQYWYRVKARTAAKIETWSQTAKDEFMNDALHNVSAETVPGDVVLVWGQKIRSVTESVGSSNQQIASVYATCQHSTLKRVEATGYTSGNIVSTTIELPADGNWVDLAFNATVPEDTNLSVDVLDGSDESIIFEDVNSGADLGEITVATTKLRANLSTDNPDVTCALHDWSVSYTDPNTTIESDWSSPVWSQQAEPPIEVAMKITPRALPLRSRGKWVKAHLTVPKGLGEGIDTAVPITVVELGLEAEKIKICGKKKVMASFDRAAFCRAGPFEGPIVVEGSLVDGRRFRGSDTVKIVNDRFRLLPALASYWLQTGCGRPDWCGGLDRNQDGIVDFADFALLDGCCR
jgi:hypothetical protein